MDIVWIFVVNAVVSSKDLNQNSFFTASKTKNIVQPNVDFNNYPTLQEENCLPSCIPGLGLLLVGLEVLVFQGGSVLAKSLATNPLLMLLLRDILQFSFQVKSSNFSLPYSALPLPGAPSSLVRP